MTMPVAARCVRALIALLASCLLAMNEHVAAQDTDQDTDLGDALRTWRSAYGEGWELEVDRETGFGSFLWGGVVPPAEGGTKSEEEQLAIAQNCAELSSALHGLECDYLVPDRCVFLPLGLANTTDKFAVRLRQKKNGVPVVHGFLSFLLARDGTLLSVESTGIPGLDAIDTTPAVSDEVALAKAISAFVADVGLPPAATGAPELVIDQILGAEGHTRSPKLAWRVAMLWEDIGVSPEAYRYSIDAQTGDVLAREDLVHAVHVTGNVKSVVTSGLYPPDHSLGAGTEVVSMPRIAINYVAGFSVGTTWTNENGDFLIPFVNPPVTVTIYYDGLFTNVNNQNGSDYMWAPPPLTQSSGNEILMSPVGVEERAQANAYRWVNELRQWIKTVNPTDTIAEISGAEIRVNAGGLEEPFPIPGCLGKYTGGSSPHLLLYRGGASPCFNGSFSTSIVHEMGHWLNDRYGIGNPITGMGEGNADVFAMYLFGSPEIAQGIADEEEFDFVRTGENSRRYCGDKSQGCYLGLHADAWPLMGAFWKMRARLIASQGAMNGPMVAAVLHNAWMNTYGQTQIRDSNVMKLLLLDDDDNDVRDGTPHYGDITRGFMEQGWPDMLADGITFSNISPQPSGYVVSQGGPHTIGVDVQAQFYPPLALQNPVLLYYRVDGGAFQAPLSPSSVQGSTYTFQIPGPSATPAKVEYYLAATDSAGQTLEFPPVRKFWRDGIIDGSFPDDREKYELLPSDGDYFFYSVGVKEVLFDSDMCSSCETDFTYFEHRSPVDGWDFMQPLGEGGETTELLLWMDPAEAFTGTTVWGQDSVEGGNPHPSHRLGSLQLRTTPPVALTSVQGSDLTFLHFRRWLTVDRADAYRARVGVQFPGRAVLLWENHRRIPHVDTGWTDVHFDLSSQVQGERCISWIHWSLDTIDALNTDRLGGWNIDDVEVYRVGSL